MPVVWSEGLGWHESDDRFVLCACCLPLVRWVRSGDRCRQCGTLAAATGSEG